MTNESKTTELNYFGKLEERSYGEGEALYLDGTEGPLAEELENKIEGHQVSVRYWITDKECTKKEAEEDALYTLLGSADVRFGARYSEITGYLWTDEEVNIGGHDLIAELYSSVGKYLHLEIKVHQ